MKNGTLIISLDFELLWGIFDKVDYREKEIYFKNTREVIPQILNLFAEYGIHCTWATVGMLFNENWDEWNSNFPDVLPDYENEKLCAYKFGRIIQSKATEKMCFAPDLIREISNTPGQEIGTHTYSHYYCLENGQNTHSFRADLEQVIKVASELDIELHSLVFPRNQLNGEYLEICAELGIKTVRSNPSSWYWKDTEKNKLIHKIFRTGEAYMGINDKSYKISNLKNENKSPLSQLASRFLRSHSSISLLNKLRLKRIKSEMTKAAKYNEVYHLWWHPHNFGNNPQENLKALRLILIHYQSCKEKYNFESKNMDGIYDRVVRTLNIHN